MPEPVSVDHDRVALDAPPLILQATSSFNHSRNPFRARSDYQHLAPTDQDIVEHEEFGYGLEQTRASGLSLKPAIPSPRPSAMKRKPTISSISSRHTRADSVDGPSDPRNSERFAVEHARRASTTPTSIYSLQDSHFKDAASVLSRVSEEKSFVSQGCPAQGDLVKRGHTWFTITILALALFSWVFSALLLGLGMIRPRWGRGIGAQGGMSYATATLLSALVSKLVELSFCTSFVATLGQILTRRALATGNGPPNKQGISLAETNMRLWILQPGTLITHWTGARYVLASTLGIMTLVAAASATFYTTAAEALVSPKLKYGNNETLHLYGEVLASYANVNWLAKTCVTPTLSSEDPSSSKTTCVQIDLKDNGYRAFNSWLSVWADIQKSLITVSEQAANTYRPPPKVMLYDNTTVLGTWLHSVYDNETTNSQKFQRYIQNTTLVMPHANVYHAARYSRNKRILQPDDLQGAGAYYLKAAVPSPAFNALCVGVQEYEVAPLIGNGTWGSTPAGWPNISTPIDDIFGWSQNSKNKYPYSNDAKYDHPWFVKLPIGYNTIANATYKYGNPSFYIIAKPPPDTKGNDYVICGLQSFLVSNCSTSLFVESSRSELSVHCNTGDTSDPETWLTYSEARNKKIKPPPDSLQSKDYHALGVEWLRAVDLNTGYDANSSISRLLTRLIPSYSNETGTLLAAARPGIAEALCVLTSYTLLLSSRNAPFVHYWDYAHSILYSPAEANFSAILSYKDYSSGGDQQWKGIFYVILFSVFVLNTFCVACLFHYFVIYGEVTDYTEPQNLFALAINSPSSQVLAGSCGAGPSSHMLRKKWCVDMVVPEHSHGACVNDTATESLCRNADDAPHYFVRYPEEEPLLASLSGPTSGRTGRFHRIFNPNGPRIRRTYTRSTK